MIIKKTIIFSSILMFLFISSAFLSLLSITNQTSPLSLEKSDDPLLDIPPRSSQFAARTVRVAIYNEPNISRPYYGGAQVPSILTNNYSDVYNLLMGAGYQVTELTVVDISDHKLRTADYDVFIMADNVPRENITNLVEEFWLGGGGIISFDSAISYICYAGMLPPDSKGSISQGTYWNYVYSDIQNVTTRHPITKAFQVNDTFSVQHADWATFDWAGLQTTSVASDLVKLATKSGSSNDATVVALDHSLRGGRVVHILKGNYFNPNMEDLIIDTVDWLCPRPKARILFDLSHNNGYGINAWDDPYVQYSGSFFSTFRDTLVNRSYTIDKLYPSFSESFTASNLAPYDLLIVNLPDTNFTASEVATVTNWVNYGGGLFALANLYSQDGSMNLNYLLSSLDLATIGAGSSGTMSTSFLHPTEEGCTDLEITAGSEIGYSGDAFPLWGISASNIRVAGQEYGKGRVILSGDLDLFDNTRMASLDNEQYSINVANWLTACEAEVIIYIDSHPTNSDPNDNYYNGPVARALNDLNIPFYLTFNSSYFNMSLVEENWKLAVIDNNYYDILPYASDIIDYIEDGGRLIVRSWRQRYQSTLWEYLGYTPNGTGITAAAPIINIWNPGHPIFTAPALYGANNITTSLNPFITDFCYVKLHDNATAIAGLSSAPHENKSAIILSDNGRIISNTMALTEYYDDTDDSTYPDALEIWENEIAYMMSSYAPSGGGDGNGDGDDKEAISPFLLWIIIGAIIGVIAIAAIVILLKKGRK